MLLNSVYFNLRVHIVVLSTFSCANFPFTSNWCWTQFQQSSSQPSILWRYETCEAKRQRIKCPDKSLTLAMKFRTQWNLLVVLKMILYEVKTTCRLLWALFNEFPQPQLLRLGDFLSRIGILLILLPMMQFHCCDLPLSMGSESMHFCKGYFCSGGGMGAIFLFYGFNLALVSRFFDTEKLFLIDSCPSTSSWHAHASQFLRLESQRTNDFPCSTRKFCGSWIWTIGHIINGQ